MTMEIQRKYILIFLFSVVSRSSRQTSLDLHNDRRPADWLKERNSQCVRRQTIDFELQTKSLPQTREICSLSRLKWRWQGRQVRCLARKKTWNSRMHGTQNFCKNCEKKLSESKKLMSCEYGLLIDCLDRVLFLFRFVCKDAAPISWWGVWVELWHEHACSSFRD